MTVSKSLAWIASLRLLPLSSLPKTCVGNGKYESPTNHLPCYPFQIKSCTGSYRGAQSIKTSKLKPLVLLLGRCSDQISPYMAIITPTPPPKTINDVVRAARSALRKLRDTTTLQSQQQTRLIIRLPFPSPSSPPDQADLLRAYDEGEWPGGIQQKFRSLKPLVETLLEGYQPSFVGMLESPADGIGVWSAGSTMTITTLVSNPTFSPFAKLCSGEYGSNILQNDHTILCINPSWTSSRDIGQLWDGKLRRQAALLIDDGVASPPWVDVYNCTDVRTPSGATGLLLYSYGGQWEIWFCPEDEELYQLTDVVLTSDEKPELKVLWAALDGKRREYNNNNSNSSGGDRKKKKKNGWW